MMNEILMYLVSGVLTICVTAVTRAVIEWLRQKKLLTTAKIAVEAAEQMIKESEMGPRKKAETKAYILGKFPKLSESDLDVLIEAAVLGINRGTGGVA